MLLTACVTAQFWAAARVRPLAYWTAAALAMLTKGPIGILIPALSLSIYWQSEGTLRQRWRELRWMPGLPLALVPFAAWFAAAIWRGVGQADIRMRVGLAGTIGLVVWSPLASTFVPLSDAGVPIDARVAAALVGAVAGFGYGAVLGAVVGRLSNESAND